VLSEYQWPGNVRELRNFIERAVLQKPVGKIDTHHLLLLLGVDANQLERLSERSGIHIPEEGVQLDDTMLCYLRAAIRKVGGNKTRAAKLRGITRNVLRYRLEKYGKL